MDGALSAFDDKFLTRDHLEDMVAGVGREHLDGGQAAERANGRIAHIRAFGVPTAHGSPATARPRR